MPVAEGPGESFPDAHKRQNQNKVNKHPLVLAPLHLGSFRKTLLADIFHSWVEIVTQWSPSYRLGTCCSENWRDLIIHPVSGFERWVTIWMDIHLVWMLLSQKFRFLEGEDSHRQFDEREDLIWWLCLYSQAQIYAMSLHSPPELDLLIGGCESWKKSHNQQAQNLSASI